MKEMKIKKIGFFFSASDWHKLESCDITQCRQGCDE